MKALRTALQEGVFRACELDVKALKPGNVSIESPGHGMSAADFLLSAAAIAKPITTSGIGVGERIYRAIEATQFVVTCNTNLGIVLLLAPLIQAAESGANLNSLENQTHKVLDDLTVADADWAYRAIRLAKPGGMGQGMSHDIAESPTITLFEAMQVAAPRDQIACLYSTGFHSLFNRNLPVWRDALVRWGEREWAATAVFLESLAREPDSLISRKFGIDESKRISQAAIALWRSFSSTQSPNALRPALMVWDAELKAKGFNPGSTADITVATAFLAGLQDIR